LEAKGELFGGKASKITGHGIVASAESVPASSTSSAAKASAKATAKAISTVATKPGPTAGTLGCSKCRYSASGCLRCSAEKFAKWIAKKDNADDSEVPPATKAVPEKDEGGKAGNWDAEPEDELVMPKDDLEGHEDPPPDDFEADNGEFDADALSVLEAAFEGSVS
jgi:hypothetical protein